MKKPPPQKQVSDEVAAGAAIYSQPLLAVYDLFVLGFSNRFVWECPSPRILDFYNRHVSAKHLDAGVGTGYFLDKCTFPVSHPTIALVDLNENSLQVTAKRLNRYHPSVHIGNVLEPLKIEPAHFDSVAINYLLHCLPGHLPRKGIVFRHLKPLLHPRGGVIFGTTILGKGIKHNILAQALMRAYNAKGIFSNLDDTAADLENILRDTFREYSLQVVGCVAFFVGHT